MRFALLVLFVSIVVGCSAPVQSGYDYRRGGSKSGQTISSERTFILNESRKWLGTPYRYGGSSRSGADCSGFVSTVFAKLGVSLPRRARDMYTVGTPISRSSIVPGDLVFFSNTAGKGITHVGIYTGSSKFIHASSSSGVVYSSLDQSYYNKHYAGARQVLR